MSPGRVHPPALQTTSRSVQTPSTLRHELEPNLHTGNASGTPERVAQEIRQEPSIHCQEMAVALRPAFRIGKQGADVGQPSRTRCSRLRWRDDGLQALPPLQRFLPPLGTQKEKQAQTLSRACFFMV